MPLKDIGKKNYILFYIVIDIYFKNFDIGRFEIYNLKRGTRYRVIET